MDPAIGVDLTYFVNDAGFSKKMCPINAPGPVWIDGLLTVPDGRGMEELVAHYVRVKTLGELYEQGIAVFDDEKEIFEPRVKVDVDSSLVPKGHPLRHSVEGDDFFYFPSPFPSVRVRATLDAVLDPGSYEAFTCFVSSSDDDLNRVERKPGGEILWGWKPKATPIDPRELRELSETGRINESESCFPLRDVETSKPVLTSSGSIYWNPYRERWIAILLEAFGSSFLGEIWFAEADTPLGPWVYARKIVTHDNYSFYNPTQHPYFDRDGGRTIFFEGTYTATFANNPPQTPHYDYNQILYRLRLDDSRLALPVPVYRLASGSLATGPTVRARKAWREIVDIAFFALPLASSSGIAIDDSVGGVLGYALPLEAEETSPAMAPLHVYLNSETDERRYSTDPALEERRWVREPEPLGRIWVNPISAPTVLALVHP